jgi:hypothetical protein
MSFFESLQSIGFLTDIRESALVYPIILSTHLICIGLFGGMILMTDLRLLGVGMRHATIAEVVNGLRIPKRVGLVVIVICGLLLFSSEAVKYEPNPIFWAKMIFLALAIIHYFVFRSTIYNHPEELDKAPVIPGRVKTAAVLSMVIWTCIPVCGRLIAYYEPNKGKPAQTAQHSTSGQPDAIRVAVTR